MRTLGNLVVGICAVVCLAVSSALADPNVQATDIGVNGNAVGFNAGNHIKHFIVLVAKGSRYVVYQDGVLGPKVEAMDWTGGTRWGSSGSWSGIIPAVFTPDGEHYTYCYKDGDDIVIMLDGKEVGRVPEQTGLQMPLTFSQGGQHLAWGISNSIVMDGKQGPASRYQPQVYFSPDGSHYVYLGTDPGTNNNWAFVDGRQVQYFGEINQYAPNNHLITLFSDPNGGGTVFVMDGKPEFKAYGIQHVWCSPDGKQIAIQMQTDANSKQVLTVNGKIIPDSAGAGISGVYFSPDGKRFAADCSTAGDNFMIIDGKKQDSYQAVPSDIGLFDSMRFSWAYPYIDQKTAPHLPSFTSDSSKFVYLATANAQNFLMTEDGEYDDYNIAYTDIAISAGGGHYGFIGTNHAKQQAVVIDGKPAYTAPTGAAGQTNLLSLCFSPEGSHWAFVGGSDHHVYEDGKQLPGGISGQDYIFSPDGNHIAYSTWNAGVSIDGKILCNPGPGHGVQMPLFSADSQHFYFIASGTVPNSKDTYVLYCDGKPVCHFSDFTAGYGSSSPYDLTQNGVFTFISRTDGELTKYVITPDSNIDAALATAKAAPANF